MTKFMSLILACFITFSFAAKVEFGTDIGYNFDSEIDKAEMDENYNKDKSTAHNVTVNPRISIVTRKVEFAPSILFGISTNKSEEEDQDSVIDTDRYIRFRYGVGFGAYFKVVKTDHVRLSIGPDVRFVNNSKTTDLESSDQISYKAYSNFDLSLGLPLNFDILAGDNFGLRLSSRVIAFDWSHYVYQLDEEWDTSKNSNNDFDLDITGIFSPTIGFFIRF